MMWVILEATAVHGKVEIRRGRSRFVEEESGSITAKHCGEQSLDEYSTILYRTVVL